MPPIHFAPPIVTVTTGLPASTSAPSVHSALMSEAWTLVDHRAVTAGSARSWVEAHAVHQTDDATDKLIPHAYQPENH